MALLPREAGGNAPQLILTSPPDPLATVDPPTATDTPTPATTSTRPSRRPRPRPLACGPIHLLPTATIRPAHRGSHPQAQPLKRRQSCQLPPTRLRRLRFSSTDTGRRHRPLPRGNEYADAGRSSTNTPSRSAATTASTPTPRQPRVPAAGHILPDAELLVNSSDPSSNYWLCYCAHAREMRLPISISYARLRPVSALAARDRARRCASY